jgi:ABC-type sugar transport system substrate-binding protein
MGKPKLVNRTFVTGPYWKVNVKDLDLRRRPCFGYGGAVPPIFAAGETVAKPIKPHIPFYVFMRQEAEDRRKRSIQLIIQDAQFSAKTRADLENALTQGVAGIVVAPTDVVHGPSDRRGAR